MRTLQFLDHHIHTVFADGQWWVAIKPICQALGVEYNAQVRRFRTHHIYAQLYAKKHTVGADGKAREMVCLPERYIYGWLFGASSRSEKLKRYQLECHDVLYNHFHPHESRRFEQMKQATALEREEQELEAFLSEIPEYVRQKAVRTKLRSAKTAINNIIKEEAAMQGDLFA